MGEWKYSLTLAMIVRNEEENLPVIWQSVKDIVDEWIIVDTGSTDKTVEIAKKLGAKVYEEGERFCDVLTKEHVEFFAKHGVTDVKEGEKLFNFGKARTFSFDKATKQFIMWLDADDILINSHKMREILDANLDPKKQTGLHLLYKYEVDQYQNSIVEHYRERVFPNNGRFNWVGRIHEIVVPEIETGYIQVRADDCHVLHNITPDAKGASGNRNVKNILLDLYEQGDKPDPRSLYHLAEAFVGNPERRQKALDLYLQYMELSRWDEERALVATRICDIALKHGDGQKALQWAYRSIQERPDFPMGWANVAQCYYNLDDYRNCKVFAEKALSLSQPETMILVNQKHNEFTPVILLAASHLKLGELKEAEEYAQEGLKYEPLSEFLLNVRGVCKRSTVEEKIAENFKCINEYLTDEGELVKAHELWKALPWSHEDDPRMRGLEQTSLKTLLETVKKPRELRNDLDSEKLHEELPHLAYLERELKGRGAKTVLLIDSENNQLVMDWLQSKGFEVSRAAEGKKFDAIVAFDLIDRLYNPSKMLNQMMVATKPTGICILSMGKGGCAEVDERRVRVYTVNSIRNMLVNGGVTVWTCIPLPNDVIYCSFLPGKPTEKKASVGFICGEAVEEWGPLSIYKGVGGSEEATIYLSRELAALGHDVTVYNNTTVQCTFEGVHWKHHATLNEKEEMDTAILWRAPHRLDQYNINAKKIFLWLHDVPQKYWFTDQRLERIDKIIVLSKYHRSLLPDLPDEKFIISQNGVDVRQFSQQIERSIDKVIYTSSYDRGLEHLLEIWPEVRKAVPSAELHVFYGWGNWDKMRTERGQREWKSKMLQMMNQPGVTEHGRIGQGEIAKEMLSSAIYAYPCAFEEISCISAMKAQVAGCIPLTTDYAALAETNLVEECRISGNPKDPIALSRFKHALIECLQNPVNMKTRQKISSNAKKAFSWKNVAEKWSQFIND